MYTCQFFFVAFFLTLAKNVFQLPHMAKETTAGVAKRLSIPIDDAGFIDVPHMRASTVEQLIELIKTDPTIRDTYNDANGIKDGAGLAEGLTQENVAAALDLVQSANALIFRVAAAKFIKNPVLRDQNGRPLPLVLDSDLLTRTFSLTPEQHAELDPRATRLAQKYSGKMPAWLKENMDLYMFASMFLMYTGQNAKAAIEMQIKRDVARAREAFAQQHANQPKNPKPDTDTVRTQPVNGHDRSHEPLEAGHEPLTETDTAPPPEAPTV
jgi:hypothetical protein